MLQNGLVPDSRFPLAAIFGLAQLFALAGAREAEIEKPRLAYP